MTNGTTQLAFLSQARKAIEQARSVEEVKGIRDKAEAVRQYAKAAGEGLVIQNHAAEVKIRAERKAGELLAKMQKHNGDPSLHDVTRLCDLGIERVQSHRWQTIATVDDLEFEKYVAGTVEAGHELTSAGALKLAKAAKVNGRKAAATSAPNETASLESLAAAGHKFGTIYADPPWRYGNQATRASTDNHYGTMTVDEIAALPVGELAAEQSHLWLWTTNGFLFECPRLFAAWGFEFKSSYVWVKRQIGIGNYLRNSHEMLLLAVRGGLTGAARDVRSWGEFDRAAHSAKPEEVRFKVVERMSPGPRLEMFGRKLVEGWTVWGNQIERSMFDPKETEPEPEAA